MTPDPKPVRWKSEPYKKFIRKKPCVFCDRLGQSQFHHLRQFSFTGLGTKPSDTFGISACNSCHRLDQSQPNEQSWLIAKCMHYLTEYLISKEFK